MIRLRETADVQPALNLRFRRELGRSDDARGDEAQRAAVLVCGGGPSFVVSASLFTLPQITSFARQNIFDAQHRRHHGVVLVVVFVHAIAADQVQVRARVRVPGGWSRRAARSRHRKPGTLFLANDTPIYEIALLAQPNLNQLALGELDQIVIA
jgi:hypothetical protein